MIVIEKFTEWLSYRQRFYLGFLGCVAMELSAVYFQFVVGLEPCPLCITQRMIIFVAAVVFLVAAIHNPERAGIRVYSGLGLLVTMFGFGVATYHFVIQILPNNELASCGPGASYILKHMDLTHAIRMFLTGTGDCRQIVWSLFGLSMPFWVALCFAGLMALCVVQLVSTRRVKMEVWSR
jgi:disulfide bond formation protein DsbB